MSPGSRGTVKSRPTHVVRKTKQPLTDQLHLGSRTGLSPQRFLLKYTCFSGCARLKPTAPSESHGSIRRCPALERGRCTSSTTVTISTITTDAGTGKLLASPEKIIFSFCTPSHAPAGVIPHNQTGGSSAVLCVRCLLCGAYGSMGGGAPTPQRSQYGIDEGVATPSILPKVGTEGLDREVRA